MCNVYGYCRISTAKQSIERQERNILAAYPAAHILKETYSGTTTDRPVFERLLKSVKSGDTIVFDSVSRMSRNAEQGVALYMQMNEKGIRLAFLKEPYINTETYKQAMQEAVPMTGTAVDCILEGINKYLRTLAAEQIKMAFDQAQKEVDDLHQRTKEGIITARMNGKHIGAVEGKKLITKKSLAAKSVIKQHSKTFGGTLKDEECARLAGCSINSFYKYKRELLAESGK